MTMPDTPTLELAIHADELADDEIAEVRDSLCQWINELAPGCEASLRKTASTTEGGKSAELVLLGQLGVALFESGAVTSLLNCLSNFVKTRRHKLSFSVADANGRTISIEAEGLGRDEIERLVGEVRELIGE